MSARYELRERGVYDRESARVVVPEDGAPWAEYHDVWLKAGNVPDPPPAPAAPAPTPQDGHDFAAAGRARARRQIEKLAKTDPLKAALLIGGIET